MRYRTRKYLIRTISYSVFFILLVCLYILAAHQKRSSPWSLPAVFEAGTGEFVRENTRGLYTGLFGEEDSGRRVSTGRYQSRYWWAFLDWVTAEPGYSYNSDLLDNITEQVKQLPQNREEVLLEISSDLALVNYLKKPGSRFADVYRFELNARLKNYSFIQSFGIFNSNKSLMFGSKTFASAFREIDDKDIVISEDGFVVRVSDEDRTVGFIQGSWNIWNFPDLPFIANLGKGSVGLIVSSDSELVQKEDIPQNLERFFTGSENRSYNGPFAGRLYPFRFISGAIKDTHVIIVYPAAHLGFYVFKIILYLVIAGLLGFMYFYSLRIYNFVEARFFKPKSSWLNQGLEQAVQLNHETLELAQESQKYIHSMKEQEMKKLDAIAYRLKKLEGISRKVTVLPAATATAESTVAEEGIEAVTTARHEVNADAAETVIRSQAENAEAEKDDAVLKEEKDINEARLSVVEKHLKPPGQNLDDDDEAMQKITSISSSNEWKNLELRRYEADVLPEPSVVEKEYDEVIIIDELNDTTEVYNRQLHKEELVEKQEDAGNELVEPPLVPEELGEQAEPVVDELEEPVEKNEIAESAAFDAIDGSEEVFLDADDIDLPAEIEDEDSPGLAITGETNNKNEAAEPEDVTVTGKQNAEPDGVDIELLVIEEDLEKENLVVQAANPGNLDVDFDESEMKILDIDSKNQSEEPEESPQELKEEPKVEQGSQDALFVDDDVDLDLEEIDLDDEDTVFSPGFEAVEDDASPKTAAASQENKAVNSQPSSSQPEMEATKPGNHFDDELHYEKKEDILSLEIDDDDELLLEEDMNSGLRMAG